MKTLRVTFHRRVEQKAVHDIPISEKEYKQLQRGEISEKQLVKDKLGNDFGYNTIGWIETYAEKPKADYEFGLWTVKPAPKE